MNDRFEQQSNLFNDCIIQQLELIKRQQQTLLYVQQQQQVVRMQQPDYNVYAHNQQIMRQQQPFYNMSNSLSHTPKNQSQYLQGYQQQYPN
jgi:transcriptional regulator of acetoin/glycerol metabolism